MVVRLLKMEKSNIFFLILHDEEKTWNQEFYFKFGKLEMSDLEVKLSLSFIRE